MCIQLKAAKIHDRMSIATVIQMYSTIGQALIQFERKVVIAI